MGKNPSFPFYPSDWTRDLDDYDLEIEGAWIRICCRLWWAETKGDMTRPLKEWARILRKTERKTTEILEILIKKHIADGSFLDNQMVNLISRRMKRDFKISQIRRVVGLKGGNPKLLETVPNLLNQKPNQKEASSSSSSSSSSKNNTMSSIKEIIQFLNQQSGKNFKHTSKPTVGHITARLKEGWTLEDFKQVISVKCEKWKDDPKMVDYLRPETLFGNKFEAYLNEDTQNGQRKPLEGNRIPEYKGTEIPCESLAERERGKQVLRQIRLSIEKGAPKV